jgi:hypothetical protein
MQSADVGEGNEQDAGQVREEESRPERQRLLLSFEVGVAEGYKDRVGDDSNRRERSEKGSRVRSACEQEDVWHEKAGQQK